MNARDATRWIRQPEYTGENRCVPCTVVNLCLGGVLAGIVALVWTPLLGATVFAASGFLIYVRGYLVPGTPEITKRYFPAWLRRRFGKEPLETASTPSPGTDEPTDGLFSAGVLRHDGDAVALTTAFRTDWRARIDSVRERGVEPENVATMFETDSVSRHGDLSFVVGGTKSVRWGSEAALLADVAADDLLRERLPDWHTTEPDQRQSSLRGLRFYLEACPACGGPLSYDERRVDPCCDRPHLVAESVCDDCGAVLGDAAVVDRDETTSVRTELIQA